MRNGFAWFDELKAAFLKFPVVDKSQGQIVITKSLDTQNVWGAGRAGQSTIPMQVKISCFKNDQNSTYINLFTVCCLVRHNKNSDIYFDKNSLTFIFTSVLYRIVIKNACHKSKFPIKIDRN